MKRLLTSIVTVALVFTVVPAASAQTSTPSTGPLAFGVEVNSHWDQTNHGVQPDYGTFWVGPWTLKHGWGGPDKQMQTMRANDITPAIQFYYWGDDISQSCIENGCWSDLHTSQKTKQGWQTLADQLVYHLNKEMQGEPVMIFVETEFNKADVQTYEPLDGYLAEKAKYIKNGYPNAKVVLALGSWNTGAWTTWDRAAAASDAIGIQGMRGSTRDSSTSYDNLYEATLHSARTAQSTFGSDKEVVITDIALSSYPDSTYLQKQAASLQKFFDGMDQLKAAGVTTLIYRSWFNNPGMDLKNYYGEAERHWGLKWDQYSDLKPAGKVWIAGVQAERASGGSSSPPPTTLNLVEAESFATKTAGGVMSDSQASGGKAWNLWSNGYIQHPVNLEAGEYEVSVRSRGDPAAGVNPHMVVTMGGAQLLQASPGSTYAEYKGIVSLSGAADLRIAFTNDVRTTTEDRNLIVDRVTFKATSANQAPTASFVHAAQALSVAFDASGSKDMDGDALTYAWKFGDGTSGTGVKPSHTYAAAGTYTAMVTVSDGKASTSASKSISVSKPAAFTASFEPSKNVNEWWIDVTVQGSNPVTKVEAKVDSGSWIDLPKTSWGTWAKSINAPQGSTVLFRATDGHGQSVQSEPFTWLGPVNQAPAASFVHTAQGLSVAFDAAGSSDADGDALTYTWSFGDGRSGSGVAPSHTYAAAGTYTVTLTVSDGKQTASASKEVTVAAPNQAPVASFVHSAKDLSVGFDAAGSSDADGDALTYAWSFGDGTRGSGVAPSHTYAAAGTYTVTLTVSDGRESASASKSVTATKPAAFTASFEPSKNVNEWWIDVMVQASSTPTRVEAKVNDGTWTELPKTSWGTYAKSVHAPKGSTVVFRATDASGQVASSDPFTWLGPTFSASFTPKSIGNSWWVEAQVTANEPVTEVHARVDGGQWITLSKTDWGTWAKSFHVKKGAQVQFQATSSSGATATSSSYTWR